MATQSEWDKVKPEPLGSGGQSTVFLVRKPERKAARDKSFAMLKVLSGIDLSDPQSALDFARASADIAREENASELGALKIFKPRAAGPEAEQQALGRMQNEIAVLERKRPGFLKLLDYNKKDNWIVTEYCPRGTLADHLPRYKGNAKLALTSFLSLVKTVLELHKESIVHREIKPQNIFMGDGDDLLLGDFGIVFLPDQPDRLSVTGESVGPRDIMPPWVFLNEQPGEINPTFDVYMLGKILWRMVAGRLKLHREEFLYPQLNVANLWPNDPDMHIVNTILGKCVVTREQDCLSSAQDLYLMVGAYVEMMKNGGHILRDDVPRPCRVCGVGFYRRETFEHSQPRIDQNKPVGLRFWSGESANTSKLTVRTLTCDKCGHLELFSAERSPLK
jgi:serine/threonine protein kinase